MPLVPVPLIKRAISVATSNSVSLAKQVAPAQIRLHVIAGVYSRGAILGECPVLNRRTANASLQLLSALYGSVPLMRSNK